MNRTTPTHLRKFDRLVDPRSPTALIVFDLEATCWEPEQPDRREILEIGAVKVAIRHGAQRQADTSGSQAHVGQEYSEVVQPVVEPVLSDFCLSLVPIRQDEADVADPYPLVFARFKRWIGIEPFWLGSWGAFDRRQLEIECRRHAVRMPAGYRGHVDLRREFGRWKQVDPRGLPAALELLGLQSEGTPHRALDDARNLARLTRILLEDRLRRRRDVNPRTGRAI